MEKETDGALLRMVDIEKSFPGVRALDGVSLTLYPGTVHALMGENGAGKSTLMKILFGVYSKDGGRIFFEGEEVEFKNPKTALERGVAMVHQELNQALKLSVMDNIWLGRFPRVSPYLPFTSDKRMAELTRELFDELLIDVDPKSIVPIAGDSDGCTSACRKGIGKFAVFIGACRGGCPDPFCGVEDFHNPFLFLYFNT